MLANLAQPYRVFTVLHASKYFTYLYHEILKNHCSFIKNKVLWSQLCMILIVNHACFLCHHLYASYHWSRFSVRWKSTIPSELGNFLLGLQSMYQNLKYIFSMMYMYAKRVHSHLDDIEYTKIHLQVKTMQVKLVLC